MLTFATLALAAACTFALSRAQVIPTGPAPGDKFISGQDCTIQWDADTTGTWKTAYIELMSGNNIDMIHLTTVTTFDGTDASKTSFTWTCPKVTLQSPVYFYQFTSTGTGSPEWTGRFSITADGNPVAAPNATQPDGSAKPWGNGALANPADGTPAPPTSPEFVASGSGSASVSASGSASASGSSSSTASVISGAPGTISFSASGSQSSSGSATQTGSSSGTGTTTGAASSSTATGGAATLVASSFGTVLLSALSAALLSL